MTSQKTKDFLMAYDIHKEMNCLGVTENAIQPGKVLYTNVLYKFQSYLYIENVIM